MRILFFGDIFGRPGREALASALPRLRKAYKPHIIIANVENIAHGKGITRETLEEVRKCGVDVFTSGNHIWAKKEGNELLDDLSIPVIRPANYSSRLPGRGVLVFEKEGKRLLVINLLGQVFMREVPDSPFEKIDRILKTYARRSLPVKLIDFHGEATSEKKAFGWYVDGRVSAVLGTHTHVPTADLQILPKKTAYISDVGMVGPHHSIIGANPDAILAHFLNKTPIRLEVAGGRIVEVNGVFLDIDSKKGFAAHIEQIREIVEIDTQVCYSSI